MTVRSSLSAFFGFGAKTTRLGWLSTRQWVWLFVALSATFQVWLSLLSYADFRLQAGDLAIWMQAYANTGNGRFFWTTLPYLRYGSASLVNVHFSWALFATYPLYVAFPSPTTLFVVQAVVVALAAIPLEALTSTVTGSRVKGLVVALLYLAWAPIYAGMPNSFHLEAFLPVQFFLLAYLWVTRQYKLGLVVAVFASFTIDAAPVLTFLLAIWLLTYPFQSFLRLIRRRVPNLAASQSSGAITVTRPPTIKVIRAFFRSKEVRAGIALALLAVVVFFVMRFTEADLPMWLGFQGQTLSVTRVIGASFRYVGVDLTQKVVFWLFLGLTVGFLPLLYPRFLILMLPWIGYTFLTNAPVWYEISSHYVAIAAVPLFLGVAFAMQRLTFIRSAHRSATDQPERDSSTGEIATPKRRARTLFPEPGRSWLSAIVSIVLILFLLVLNLMFIPTNPLTSSYIEDKGGPIFKGIGDPYAVTYPPQEGVQQIQALVKLIPSDALLLTDTDFTPFVAANPNMYTYNSNFNRAYLPFNSSHLPDYVLVWPAQISQFDNYIPNFSNIVWNTHVYGVRGWIQSTRLGPVYLFERGYDGPVSFFGPTVYHTLSFAPGSGLVAGTIGKQKTAVINGSSVRVIDSVANAVGGLWAASASATPLPSGSYRISVNLEITAPNSTTCGNGTGNPLILSTTGNISGGPTIFTFNVTRSGLICNSWTVWSQPFDLVDPLPGIVLDGIRPTSKVSVGLDVEYVELTPVVGQSGS